MKLFYVTLLLGFSLVGSAQNKISGITSDKENKPLSNVIVSLPEIHKETISDTDGKYTLVNLPNGTFKILFSAVGYSTQTLSISFLGKEITQNIALEDNIIHMDEVIVSTAFNKLQSQNVMKVEHESVKSLQQKGATTLIEGLAKIPGVSQVSTGTSIGKPVIRGLSGNRVLVYSQGVRLENQQFGEEHGLGLNDAGVESMEVIKGPASLLYGSDALGGVLYFNPEKFANSKEFKADFSQRVFSNTLGSNTSLGIKTSTENWKFLARGSFNTHADYQIPDGNRITNTRYNESDLKAGIGYSNSKFSSVLRYNFNKLDLGIPEEGIGEQSTSHSTIYPKQAVDNHILSLHNNFYFKNSKLDADLGYIFNDRSEFTDSNVASLHMKLRTLNYDLKYYLPKLGKVETIVGLQGMHQTNKNSGEELLIPDAATNDFGVFGTANYEFGKNVLQAGLRFDNRQVSSETHGIIGNEGYFEAIDKSFDSFNASLGFKTNLADDFTLRLNIASGFRAPNLAELTSNGVHEGSNRYEIGNANLLNEQNLQTDLNLEYKSSHFEIFANGFYNHINNYIFISPNGNVIAGNNVYDYVQANAKLYGGEAGIHFHPHPLDWLHFTSSFETVIGKKDEGSNLPLIPANKWNNTFKGEFELKNWFKEGFATLNIESTFAQNNNNEFETRTNDYTLLNLGLGGKIIISKAIFNFNLNANNVFDKTYISHLSRLKTDGIPNIGRNIILGVNFII
ncbi:TonB-dependent receptor [Flavobacterium paronense]|uniref:TonB-dependent receptor domain-containing protein n=1 Tax=Flavobacterium paronense TaxID=1392775 RepID=A0ABV5GF71_9FLAO|nr:TonB-dependent receptor [Flavobacterium paronense]MDN3678611.1 TonB-dependent receptor [Flavobacterium paronense]